MFHKLGVFLQISGFISCPFLFAKLYNMSKRRNNNNLLLFIVAILIWLALSKVYPAFSILIFIVFIDFLLFYIKNHKKKENDKKLMNIRTLEDMKKLNWREFEKFITYIFKKKWYKAKTRKWRNDWWIDIDAELNWQKYLIQCKKWNKYKIWVIQLREFYWVIKMMWDKYKWIYITTSSLTKEAQKEYEIIKNQVELWDNSNLEQYIEEYKWNNTSNNEIKKEKILICKKCWWDMIIREAHKWEHKWEHFYWCSNYPKCRNIIKDL